MTPRDNHINNNDPSSYSGKLIVNTVTGNSYITISKILCIIAEGKHSNIFIIDSEYIKTNHLLKWYCKHLPESDFYRCHKSAIVNCRYVECLCGNCIIVKGGKRVPLSRIKKDSFKHYIMNYK
jgi:two-component system LytT family response regulator